MTNRETFKRVKFKIIIFGQIKINDYIKAYHPFMLFKIFTERVRAVRWLGPVF